MKMRSRTFGFVSLLTTAIVFTCVGYSLADSSEDDDRWRQQRDQTYDLIAREKSLLRQVDDLSRDIFEIKQAINELYKRLTAKQTAHQSANHELISVQMKLLR